MVGAAYPFYMFSIPIIMKHIILALAALAPVAFVACKGQSTQHEVADARTITLNVSGMT